MNFNSVILQTALITLCISHGPMKAMDATTVNTPTIEQPNSPHFSFTARTLTLQSRMDKAKKDYFALKEQRSKINDCDIKYNAMYHLPSILMAADACAFFATKKQFVKKFVFWIQKNERALLPYQDEGQMSYLIFALKKCAQRKYQLTITEKMAGDRTKEEIALEHSIISYQCRIQKMTAQQRELRYSRVAQNKISKKKNSPQSIRKIQQKKLFYQRKYKRLQAWLDYQNAEKRFLHISDHWLDDDGTDSDRAGNSFRPSAALPIVVIEGSTSSPASGNPPRRSGHDAQG